MTSWQASFAWKGRSRLTRRARQEKLSSATPNRDKTIHCQRKRRKKHPANNVVAESAPDPRHAAKACDNNTQTIPNNMALWQRSATCRQDQRPSISNRVPRDPAILLDLQKNCGSLKLRQFWQKMSLQQSRFRGRKQITFLDFQKGVPQYFKPSLAGKYYIPQRYFQVSLKLLGFGEACPGVLKVSCCGVASWA